MPLITNSRCPHHRCCSSNDPACYAHMVASTTSLVPPACSSHGVQRMGLSAKQMIERLCWPDHTMQLCAVQSSCPFLTPRLSACVLNPLHRLDIRCLFTMINPKSCYVTRQYDCRLDEPERLSLLRRTGRKLSSRREPRGVTMTPVDDGDVSRACAKVAILGEAL